MVRLGIPGSNLNLEYASTVRGKLNTKYIGRYFGDLGAAMARPEEFHRNSPLRRMRKSLIENANAMCPSDLLISIFLSGTGMIRFRGLKVLDSFHMSVAFQFEQVVYIPFIIKACYVTDSLSKKRLRVKSGGFLAPPALDIDILSDCNAHCIACSVQRIVMAWDQLATSAGVKAQSSWYSCLLFLDDRGLASKPSMMKNRKSL